MFTQGRIIFVAIFLLVFIAVLIWSYWKDSKVSKVHFKKAYMVLIALILFFLINFIIVKIRKYL